MIGMRTCIACRKIRPQNEMLRIAWFRGEVSVDDGESSAPGRGAYVCDNPECLKKAVKTRALNRSFHEAVAQEVYERLTERADGERR